MKNSLSLLCIALLFAFTSCNNSKTSETTTEDTEDSGAEMSMTSAEVIPGSYVNLQTGKTVYIIRDPETGYAYDSIAKVPVEFYVNTSTNDTLFQTGVIVNHSLINTDGTWKLDETKVKIDGDQIKIKDDDTKIKVDGEDSKIKEGDYKQKVEDGDVKTKDGDTKTKTDN